MKIQVTAEIIALLEINQKEAELLEYVTSYELVKSQIGNCYSEKQFKDILDDLRNKLHKISEAARQLRDKKIPTSGGTVIRSIWKHREQENYEHTET